MVWKCPFWFAASKITEMPGFTKRRGRKGRPWRTSFYHHTSRWAKQSKLWQNKREKIMMIIHVRTERKKEVAIATILKKWMDRNQKRWHVYLCTRKWNFKNTSQKSIQNIAKRQSTILWWLMKGYHVNCISVFYFQHTNSGSSRCFLRLTPYETHLRHRYVFLHHL